MILSDLGKYSMTRSIMRSLCDSRASCYACYCNTYCSGVPQELMGGLVEFRTPIVQINMHHSGIPRVLVSCSVGRTLVVQIKDHGNNFKRHERQSGVT